MIKRKQVMYAKKGLYILLFAVLIMLSWGLQFRAETAKKEYEALIEETKDDLLPVLDMAKRGTSKKSMIQSFSRMTQVRIQRSYGQ